MKITSNGITIHLEQDEISTFYDIILFALDYHQAEIKKGNSCMNQSESALTNKLVEILDMLLHC